MTNYKHLLYAVAEREGDSTESIQEFFRFAKINHQERELYGEVTVKNADIFKV